MANICYYKIKVKGKQKNCYCFVDMMPAYCGDKIIYKEEGNKEDFTLVFGCDCKWFLDYGTEEEINLKPFTQEEIEKIEDGDGWNYTIADKTFLLNVEAFCLTKDDDEGIERFFHYDCGDEFFDDCPDDLHF